MNAFYIGVFGLVGVYARYFIGDWMSKALGAQAPLPTFFINTLGALVIGVIYAYAVERNALQAELRLGIMVGLLGGFTTFSTYCLEVVTMIQQREYLYAAGYLVLSPILGVAGVGVGLMLGRKLLGGAL